MKTASGFTLIELSIVLVIIGLIVGGVLVGQDLIRAAAVRAQISQIEKFNTAANTFLGKYGYLPGDIKDPDATNFGFAPRGMTAGQGNGDGIIKGLASNSEYPCGFCGAGGETVMFWVDLSTDHLIDGGFNTASATENPASTVTGISIGAYLPSAKVGNGNYVYVWSGGPLESWSGSDDNATNNGLNYFGLSTVTSLASGCSCALDSNPGLSVQQALDIDKKIDDGLPQSGRVIAMYLNGNVVGGWQPIWAGTGTGYGAPYTSATSGSSTSGLSRSKHY